MQGFLAECFLCEFKMAGKNSKKTIFEKQSPFNSLDTLGVKILVEVTPSWTSSKIHVFAFLNRNSRWAA